MLVTDVCFNFINKLSLSLHTWSGSKYEDKSCQHFGEY